MYMLNFCDCVQCFKIGALYLLKTAYRPRVYLRIHVQYRAVICLFYTYHWMCCRTHEYMAQHFYFGCKWVPFRIGCWCRFRCTWRIFFVILTRNVVWRRWIVSTQYVKAIRIIEFVFTNTIRCRLATRFLFYL